MKIEQVRIREVQLPLLRFFETSFGRCYQKQALLIELHSEGLTGWGECVAGEGPFYSYEDVYTAWEVLCRFVLPLLPGRDLASADEYLALTKAIRGHPMAIASVECALWDLLAKRARAPLWRFIGGVRERIACGVSIGIQDSREELLDRIQLELAAGYRKIKVKIKPGWDLEILDLIRKRFPDINLMVDANSAYTLQDAARIRRFDDYGLMMIEQPLDFDDLVDHASLQRALQTPVCLDESIRHRRDALHALELGSCRVINIKIGRVGGLVEARQIHDLCAARGIPVWCGGMLETGIGRAHNIAVSTLENFSIPGDVSASKRYFERDLIRAPIEVTPDGYIVPSEAPGIGYEPDLEWIDQVSVRTQLFSESE